jgi:hypothetical protein
MNWKGCEKKWLYAGICVNKLRKINKTLGRIFISWIRFQPSTSHIKAEAFLLG